MYIKYKNKRISKIQITMYKLILKNPFSNSFLIKPNLKLLFNVKLRNYSVLTYLNIIKKNYILIKQFENCNYTDTLSKSCPKIDGELLDVSQTKKTKELFTLNMLDDLFNKKTLFYKNIYIYHIKYTYIYCGVKIQKNNKIIFKFRSYFFKKNFNLFIIIELFNKNFKNFKKLNKLFYKNMILSFNNNYNFNEFFWKNSFNNISFKFLLTLSYKLTSTKLNLVKTNFLSNNHFNSYYPFFLNINYVSLKFLKKYRKKKAIEGSHLFNIFLIGYLTNILKKNIYLRYTNNSKLKTNLLMKNYLIKTNKWFKIVNIKDFKISEFFDILLYSLILKESKIFIEYLLLIYENLPEKMHQKFTLSLKNVFFKNQIIFSQKLKVKGVFFDYKGKIGAISNAKKKRVLYAYGFPKFSNKNSRIDHQYRTVETLGGTLGLTFTISY